MCQLRKSLKPLAINLEYGLNLSKHIVETVNDGASAGPETIQYVEPHISKYARFEMVHVG